MQPEVSRPSPKEIPTAFDQEHVHTTTHTHFAPALNLDPAKASDGQTLDFLVFVFWESEMSRHNSKMFCLSVGPTGL